MKTAIITGISGQDGAYLSKLLLNKGYRVVGFIRPNQPFNLVRLSYLKIEDAIILEECDLMDIKVISKLLDKYHVDEIYNLAAISSVSTSFANPIETLKFNTLSVLNLLEAIKSININIKFYQASSSEMYGNVSTLPITLDTPMRPLSPYAISKVSAFWIVANYRESYGIYSCNGVLFNHESYLRGNNFFIKKIISECLLNSKNKDWKLSVGNIDVSRDFGYSPNYVEAMYLMLQQDNPKDFVICSGVSTSLKTIIRYIFNKFSISEEKIIVDERLFRPSEIKNIYGDNSIAKLELGWQYELDFKDVLDIIIEEELKNYSK